MRTRLLVAMTAAFLAVPLLSTAAQASSSDHKCDESVTAEHKCEEGKG